LDIFTASAQPWDHTNPALAKFPKMPPTVISCKGEFKSFNRIAQFKSFNYA